MTTILSPAAIEKSTYVITANFTDEDGDAVIPESVNWSLTDVLGVVINGRDQVGITPAASITVVLSGDDLAITGTRNAWRLFTIEAVYNSSLGSGLPLKGQQKFQIINMAKIT